MKRTILFANKIKRKVFQIARNHLNVKSKLKNNVKNKIVALFKIWQCDSRNSFHDPLFKPRLSSTSSTKRPIIIHGRNVAVTHSCYQTFSVRGIQICVDFFEQEGFEIVVVTPKNAARDLRPADIQYFQNLEKNGKLLMHNTCDCPMSARTCKPECGPTILDLAVQYDCAILSNDNFEQSLNTNTAWDTIINGRVFGFTFWEDVLLLPKDPYGRRGRRLYDILNQ